MVQSWVPFDPYTGADYWRNYLASFGFFILMCYIFVGIAIASDIFMNAIEKICGATKTTKIVKEEGGVVVITTKQTQVWNDTVANLTLMALGSSAPEILLSAIEISGGLGGQNPGELGPGTIVGSAAYNLMIISAVCILSLPKDATSRIKLYTTFNFTSFTSLFAYVWMLIVLQVSSPDVVDLWEALLTLAFFPIMVAGAYWADQDFCCRCKNRKGADADSESGGSAPKGGKSFYFGDKDEDDLYDADGNYDKKALANLYNKLTLVADLTQEEIVTILATKLIQGKQHDRMWYRSQAAKGIMGGGKNMPVLDEKLQEVVDVIHEDPGNKHFRRSILKKTITSETLLRKAVVDFQAATLAVAEAVGEFQVTINRTGKEDVGFQVLVESADGTAKKGKEYHAVKEVVKFDPYVKEQSINVKIIDNVQWNPDSNFYLKLSIPKEYEEKATVGKTLAIEIIIEDDDNPGRLAFEKRGYVFKDTKKSISIDVVRNDGTDGVVSAVWKLVPGPNCKIVSSDLSGKLEFKHGEMKKKIEIPFIAQQEKVEGHEETFDIELSNPQGGAKIGKIGRTTCAVSSDENFKLEINNVVNAALQMAEDAETEPSYGEQIMQAVKVNGGDVGGASWKDWVLHIFIFPLKFICCLIPPPGLGGGWLCFIMALLVVGLLTKIVGDTASNFGEALGMDPTITAITFVALGTSLPDTFASRIAAMNDKTADNAIGNVTGSNSVNVFLGLGVPWTIGALFYLVKADPEFNSNMFCVPAGTLYFNVIVFCICAALALAILYFRRYSDMCGNSELGGPTKSRWTSAIIMIILWMVYIGLSSWNATKEKIRNADLTYDKMLNGSGGEEYTNCAKYVRWYLEHRKKGK